MLRYLPVMFEPSYNAALQRLSNFAPKAGASYAKGRNYDTPDHVSTLSPYIRHRIITEEDVLRTILARHSPQAAQKFVQEVFWRTYWKGWLELRPSIWDHYKIDLSQAINRVQSESGLRTEWEVACKGETGIDCFDHWAQELVQTGYLHNHARMWFASIWIFTLRLPWTLGADFFLRHLLDGDAASNTLSWRWVGGLQTVGKTYLARPDNIRKYTEGRFNPNDLATFATPLDGTEKPAASAPPTSDILDPNQRTGLLISEEDLSPNWLISQVKPAASATINPAPRSPLMTSDLVTGFTTAAIANCAQRHDIETHLKADEITNWAKENNIQQIVTSYLPTGPAKDMLNRLNIKQIIRPYDQNAWPHATHGFFKFKDKIPKLLGKIKGLETM